MADLLTVSQIDIDRADTYLTAYLAGNIPAADFSEGSAIRDFVVKALAYIFAFFRNEANDLAVHNSLLKLQQLPESQSVADAVDALLSNWFVTRNDGASASLSTTLHFSQASDVTIVPAARFFRTASLIYTTGLTSSLVIPASQLLPNLNADGTVSDYTCVVTLKATAIGTAYNMAPGIFASADPFNPYFLYAENVTDGYDGKDIETTAQLLTRAPTAISVRNLINQRSIDAVLRENFPTLNFIRVIGMGDPEMMRDYVNEGVTHLRIHLGGYSDIFVALNRTPYVDTLSVGGAATRPDNLGVFLSDDNPIDYTSYPVLAGDVLYISAGLPTVPMTYIITDVEPTRLEVTHLDPFELNTDEIVGGDVTYNVGRYGPAYNSVLSGRTGQTSRKFQQAGCVLLTGQPHYKITQVQAVDPTGTLITTLTRTNTYNAPGNKVAAGYYYVWSLNPQLGQSNQDCTIVEVSPTDYIGYKLQVTYDTLTGYADIASFVADLYERVNNANQLVRGLHPIYLSYTIKYITAIDATVPVDEDAVKTAIASFVDTWNMAKPFSNSDLISYLKTTFPSIGTLYNPFELEYSLYAPDGQEYRFNTTDLVTVTPNYVANNAYLSNGLDLRTAIPNADLDATIPSNQPLITAANQALFAQLAALGISDRNIRFVALASDVTLVNMG